MSYRSDRLDVDFRFDRVETTVSHLLRVPHAALGGRAFGPALLDGLDRLSWGPGPSEQVLEIGGGTGWLAQACLRARPGLSWWCIDLSRPALCAQRERISQIQSLEQGGFLRANASALPLADGSFGGLLLCNEVIADLPVTTHEDGSLVNQGAIDFVAEISRVLAPGGRAVLTEYGGDGPVVRAGMAGDLGAGAHDEYTIHFPHLVEAAQRHGLQSDLVSLFALLQIDGSRRVASYTDLRRLATLIPSTPMISVTAEELIKRHPILTRLFHFDLPRLDSPRFPDTAGGTGAAEAFKALLLKR